MLSGYLAAEYDKCIKKQDGKLKGVKLTSIVNESCQYARSQHSHWHVADLRASLGSPLCRNIPRVVLGIVLGLHCRTDV